MTFIATASRVYSLFAATALLSFAAVLGACSPRSAPQELSDAEGEAYLQRGQAIAQATFAALSARLQAALEEGGVPHAIQYCNLAALPLTDSLARAHHAEVRRRSERPRNPLNAPDAWEASIIREYAGMLESGETPAPLVGALDDGVVAFAAPIFLAPACLRCHGVVGETVDQSDYAEIMRLYPEDKAVNYAAGELRGIWSIRFAREK
jgi:hypothetical protein